jgi:hypothetical protein
MTSSTIMAGAGAFVAALVVVAVVVAVFAGGEPAAGPAQDVDKAGTTAEPDAPLVEVEWKRPEGVSEKTREQPAVKKTPENEKAPGPDSDSEQGTD